MQKRDLFSVAVLAAAVVIFLLRRAWGLWWTFDDPYILEQVIREPLGSLLFQPETYQGFSRVNFTPLVLVSYLLDHALFGLLPTGFYAHQAASLLLTATCIYLLASRWDSKAALWAALMFLLSGPAGLASHVLMLRHYVEGAFWALLTVMVFLDHRADWKAAGLAGLTYFFACLCKETYVLLILTVPFFAGRSKAVTLTPALLIALTAYGIWRVHLLGNSSLNDAWQSLIQNGASASDWMTGLSGIAAALFAVNAESSWLFLPAVWVGVLGILLARKQYGAMLGAFIALPAALAPLVPVWNELAPMHIIGYRLSFHMAVLLALGLAYFAAVTLKKTVSQSLLRWTVWLGMALLLAFTAYNQQCLLANFRENFLTQHTQQYRFLFEQDASRTLVTPSLASLPWPEIASWRMRSGKERPPAACTMPFDLRADTPTLYYRYMPQAHAFVEITPTFLAARRRFLENISPARPLSVAIRVKAGKLYVGVEPGEEAGRTFFLIGSRPDVYEASQIPADVEMRIPVQRDFPYYVRVAKAFPDGSWGLSPEWRLNFAREQDIKWTTAEPLDGIGKERPI